MEASSRSLVAAVSLLAAVFASGVAAAQSRGAPPDRGEMGVEGRAIQGGLLIGRADPNVRVKLDGRRIRVGRDGTFLVGFPMDAPATMVLEVVSADGSNRKVQTFRVEQRQYGTERLEGLPEEEVNLDRQTQAQVNRSHRRIEKIRRRFTPESSFDQGFDWPARGRVSTPFGVRRILDGQPRSPHDAIDIAVPSGTAVRSPAGGVVVFAEEDVPLSGHTVVVDHGLGLTSTFLHLSNIRVRVGQRVDKGATLGLSGDTGRTTGANLHWAMHLSGVALDPELIVPPQSATNARTRRRPAAPRDGDERDGEIAEPRPDRPATPRADQPAPPRPEPPAEPPPSPRP